MYSSGSWTQGPKMFNFKLVQVIKVASKAQKMGSRQNPAFEMRLLDFSHSGSHFNSLGRYWVLFFFLSFVMTALQKFFMGTVKASLGDRSSFLIPDGRKTERDAAFIPEINMDLGFRYGVQLSQHSYSFVVWVLVHT